MSAEARVGWFGLDDQAEVNAADESEFYAYANVALGGLAFVRLIAREGQLLANRADEATLEVSEDPDDQWMWVEGRGDQHPEFSLLVERQADDGKSVTGYEHAVYNFATDEWEDPVPDEHDEE